MALTQRGSSLFGGGGSVAVGSGGAGGAAITSLDGLSDVTITSLQDGQLIESSGGVFVNTFPGIASRADDDGTVALVSTDRGTLVTAGHATANAVSLPQAGTSNIDNGWYCFFCTTGAGLSTITPTTSTINGAATLPIPSGDCVLIMVDSTGSNYRAGVIPSEKDTVVQMEIFAPTTDTATGDGQAYFVVPARITGFNLVGVNGQVVTAGTTGTLDVQIARCAAAATGNVCSGTVVDMLSTKLTVDSAENSSDTAATAAVINTSNDDVVTGQVLRIDVDAVHTTAAKGLVVTMVFRRP